MSNNQHKVEIHHPLTGHCALVAPKAVNVWEASGWKQGPKPDTEQAPAPSATQVDTPELGPAPGAAAPQLPSPDTAGVGRASKSAKK